LTPQEASDFREDSVMTRFGFCLLACVLGSSAAVAQDTVSFQGKTVTMIIGFPPGGGTDAYGRVVATSFEKYLPGNPTVIVKNVPGADGVTSMNFMVQQVVPDGTTLTTTANTTADPLNYRKPQVHYVPTDFAVIGGAGRGGEVILINKESEKRLYDKNAAPVVMGSLGGVPRSGMQMTAWGIEFLGWNAKWVIGYRGTNELTLALERGEIDMTATGNRFLIEKLVDSGKFRILVQSGTLKNGKLATRPEFGDAPLIATALEGKLKDALALKAFDYWSSISLTDKWLALPPKTPKNVVEVYRAAYGKIAQDADFLERARKISEDFVPLTAPEVEALITKLASLPQEAPEYMTVILRKQGLDVQ
jgi:tripartite-type tricarboxylate transporter receptor subunit TctC